MNPVEVISATVDLDEVTSYRTSMISLCEQVFSKLENLALVLKVKGSDVHFAGEYVQRDGESLQHRPVRVELFWWRSRHNELKLFRSYRGAGS